MVVVIGLLTYYGVGYGLMYPGGHEGGFFAFGDFGINAPDGPAGGIEYAAGTMSRYTEFIFQAMFAATAATIVSGAVAERMKLNVFLFFSALLVGLAYPITGFWKWGYGWLDALETPFYDFAGSTLVHAVGGWAALAAVILLGPRLGKYTSRGIKPIPGHNMPLAAIGVFLLWFGWFGFNGGSVLSADPVAVAKVFVTTSLAAAGGAMAAFFTSYALFKSHDLSMVLNGILGGLVGITAGADLMTPFEAILIGGVAGVLIPFAVVFFDKRKLDDPVGATSVHLVCGVWGTLAVGIFGANAGWSQFVSQLIGTLAVGAFIFSFAFSILYLLKKTVGIRVTEEEEIRGLDIAEHDMQAYQDVQETAMFDLATVE